MNSNSLVKILVLVGGLILAVVMGNLLVTDSFTAFLWIAIAAVVATCIYLERRIWLLIPFLGSVEITLRIPGLPTSLMLAQALVLAFSLVLFLMRRLPYHPRWSELESWCLLLMLMVIQVYIRNPVGLNIFGGSSVGGKPYVLFALALVTGVLLMGLRVEPKHLKAAMYLSILGGMMNFCISLVGRFVPAVGYWTASSYVDTRGADDSYVGKQYDAGAATREYFLMIFGRNLSLWISAFRSPLKACFHPFWAPLVLLALAVATYSGFRNAVAMVGLTYFVGLCYRGGIVAVFASFMAGIVAIALLAVANSIAPLPPNIQRALSFLPGTWEQRYIEDARGSTEWRFDIWKEVLTSDRWIHNKILGDGLGFSARELAYQASLKDSGEGRMGVSGFDLHREGILASGDYHSGPVQVIRTIGYVGLIVILLFQIRLAIHAHRQIVRCKGTEWFPVALFFGIPLIWNPIFFVFVIGDFKSASATLFLGSAMIRLLQKNLPLPAWSRAERVPTRFNPKLPKPAVARLSS
jgi:hypothetical protein